jgi:hypothetical protein
MYRQPVIEGLETSNRAGKNLRLGDLDERLIYANGRMV